MMTKLNKIKKIHSFLGKRFSEKRVIVSESLRTKMRMPALLQLKNDKLNLESLNLIPNQLKIMIAKVNTQQLLKTLLLEEVN